MNSKLTAEGIMGAAMRMGAELSGGEFPISVFPHKIQRIITELHASQGYPIDYIAAAMLLALAVSIGNSHLAQVKRGWVESPILYMALIGRPGANKSHPLSFAFHPFIEHNYRHNKEYQEQYAEYQHTMSMTKKERLEVGKDEFPIPPKRSRFLVSDITPEGLSLIHAQNPRALYLWSDELSTWFKNFNRYNNDSEEQFWLSVFNAKPTILDRKSSQSSIFIKRLYISVVGTIQQKILGELGKGERVSNGFIDRILFVMPQSVQKSRWSDRETPEELEQEQQHIINRLFEQECEFNEQSELLSHHLPFREVSKRELYAWQHDNARRCDLESNEVLLSIYCKLEIYIIRFALIIQLAHWTCGECDTEGIDIESVRRAIELAEYFRTTAIRVQTSIGNEQLNELHRTIYHYLPQRFTTAEGIALAESYGMKEYAFKMMLKRNLGTLFKKINHGEYSNNKTKIKMRYRFILEPYKGVSSRHFCPNCHRKSCFARYIDIDEQIRFPDYVGRCNHEQKCCYNYTPKMYFTENPDARERLNYEYRLVVKPIKVESLPPSFIEPKMMQLSMQHFEKNHLYQFLKTKLGKSSASELMQRYNVGSSKHWTGATVFW